MGKQHSEELLITSVEKQKKSKHRYNIYLNDTYAFSVHEDILIKYRLLKGESLLSKDLEKILQQEEMETAFQQALRYIGRRPRTVKEITLKLKEKGFEKETIEPTIAKLSQLNYINDRIYAKQVTEQRVYSQKKGRRLVQQELAQRGVSMEDITTAIQLLDEERELKSALELGLKKWNQQAGSAAEKRRKLVAFLMRRGYTNVIIRQVLIKCGSSDQEGDEDFMEEDF